MLGICWRRYQASLARWINSLVTGLGDASQRPRRPDKSESIPSYATSLIHNQDFTSKMNHRQEIAQKRCRIWKVVGSQSCEVNFLNVKYPRKSLEIIYFIESCPVNLCAKNISSPVLLGQVGHNVKTVLGRRTDFKRDSIAQFSKPFQGYGAGESVGQCTKPKRAFGTG
jgi:hypothetical protein